MKQSTDLQAPRTHSIMRGQGQGQVAQGSTTWLHFSQRVKPPCNLLNHADGVSGLLNIFIRNKGSGESQQSMSY